MAGLEDPNVFDSPGQGRSGSIGLFEDRMNETGNVRTETRGDPGSGSGQGGAPFGHSAQVSVAGGTIKTVRGCW